MVMQTLHEVEPHAAAAGIELSSKAVINQGLCQAWQHTGSILAAMSAWSAYGACYSSYVLLLLVKHYELGLIDHFMNRSGGLPSSPADPLHMDVRHGIDREGLQDNIATQHSTVSESQLTHYGTNNCYTCHLPHQTV